MQTVSLNIILQLIEALICFDFYESTSRTNKKLTNLMFVISGYLVMCIVNLVFNYNGIINTIALVVFQFLFAYFLYKQKALFSILYSILFTCLVTITELSVISGISAITNNNAKAFIGNTYSYIVLIVMSKSLLFFTLKIISAIINKYHSNEKFNFALLFFPLILLIVLIDFGLVLYYTSPPKNIKLLLAISSLLLTTAVIVICLLQQQESQKAKELLELKSEKQQQEFDEKYFELLEHQNNEMQIFAHDIKKHLSSIYILSDKSPEIKQYINNLSYELDNTNKIGKTHNKLLDLLIDNYKFICEKSQITFETNIHTSNLDFMSNTDITSLFNNLLDNAIEAALVSQKKLVSFEMNTIDSILFIDVENSSDNKPKSNSGMLMTSKEKNIHGFGFKSVSKVVKKYGGDIEWEYNEEFKTFSVSIIFKNYIK